MGLNLKSSISSLSDFRRLMSLISLVNKFWLLSSGMLGFWYSISVGDLKRLSELGESYSEWDFLGSGDYISLLILLLVFSILLRLFVLLVESLLDSWLKFSYFSISSPTALEGTLPMSICCIWNCSNWFIRSLSISCF